ncbi:MAG TPA: dihydrolipoamide acetyltransferase family protein, partial [Longimicrobiaceae bacterium]|nr:dihydrolipoamide acetyltransferase family protein [Longimicrobiaceae bacterium]
MATKVYMEALSPTMEEGRLAAWLKQEGDEVKEGDVLAEVETDKATMELVARGAGVLRKLLIGEGDTANVGTVIGVIAAPDEDIASLVGGEASAPAAAAPAAQERAEGGADAGKGEGEVAVAEPAPAAPAAAAPPAASATPAAAPPPAQPAAGAQDGAGAEGNGRVKASPLARRLAAEAGMQIGAVQGSGPGGRIVKRDVEEAVKSGGAPERAAAAAAAPPAAEAGAGYRDQALSPMRKTIAKRLTQSLGPVPHFFLTVEVDMEEAGRLRARMNERLAEEGVKLSPNDLVIRAVAGALRRHPWVNAAWTGDAVRFHDRVHIGVAVAVDEGLITPVVHDADRKGLAQIAAEVRELAGRAREKKLKPEEYTGSTFSISNLGMMGIKDFSAIINPPEAAILAVGAVRKEPVV